MGERSSPLGINCRMHSDCINHSWLFSFKVNKKEPFFFFVSHNTLFHSKMMCKYIFDGATEFNHLMHLFINVFFSSITVATISFVRI